MNNIYPYLICLFVIFSCQEEKQIPDYIISEEEMINVLVDLELKQAEIKYRMAQLDTQPKNYSQEYIELLKQHQLTIKEFNKNLDYYCSQPLIMHDVYIKVIEVLSQKESQK